MGERGTEEGRERGREGRHGGGGGMVESRGEQSFSVGVSTPPSP